jgi:hypothetical protein
MSRGFKSRAPKMSAPGSFMPREGVFIGELIGAQLYWSTNFNAPKDTDISTREDCDLNLGFMFAIEDPDSDNEPMENDEEGRYLHVEGFVRLQVDKDGNFGPGGSRAKANKIMTGLYGESFDAFDEDFEFALYAPKLEEFNDIYEVPHYQEYDKGEEWMRLTELSVNGANLIGRKAQLQFGYAEKPNGTKSEKVTIIHAMPMPKTGGKKKAAAMKSGAAKKGENGNGAQDVVENPFEKEASTPKAEARVDVSTLPQHIRWVVARLTTPPLNIQEAHWLPFLQHFTEDAVGGPIATLEDLDRVDAKSFKGLWEADEGEQLAEMYREWAKERALSGKPAADADGDDEFAEDELPF